MHAGPLRTSRVGGGRLVRIRTEWVDEWLQGGGTPKGDQRGIVDMCAWAIPRMNDKFSDRIGATRPRRNFQTDDMDASLRNALWNWVCWALDKETTRHSFRPEYWSKAAHGGMWDEVFHLAEDEIPLSTYIQSQVKKRFMECAWFDVYNIVQWLLPRVNKFRGAYDRHTSVTPTQKLNNYLEREMSGYRAVNDRLVPVTSPTEVAEIQQAATPRPGFEVVAAHIDSALSLIGKKPDPDYRNSVKESISAVEAAVNLLTGKSGGIDDALRVLEKQRKLHPASNCRSASCMHIPAIKAAFATRCWNQA